MCESYSNDDDKTIINDLSDLKDLGFLKLEPMSLEPTVAHDGFAWFNRETGEVTHDDELTHAFNSSLEEDKTEENEPIPSNWIRLSERLPKTRLEFWRKVAYLWIDDEFGEDVSEDQIIEFFCTGSDDGLGPSESYTPRKSKFLAKCLKENFEKEEQQGMKI